MPAQRSKINQFPLFRTNIPASAKAVIKLKGGSEGDRLLYSEIIRAHNLWKQIKNLTEAETRSLLIAMAKDAYGSPQDGKNFLEIAEHHLELAFEDESRLLSFLVSHVPQTYSHLLSSDGNSGSRNLHDLFAACFASTNPHDSLGRIRQFEARRKLLLVQLLWEIRLHPDINPEILMAEQKRLESYLEKKLFDGTSSSLTFRSLHNPDNNMRVVKFLAEGEKITEGEVRQSSLLCRFMIINGRKAAVIFESSRKKPASLVLKMLARNERVPSRIGDLLRVKIVFMDERDMRHGLRLLRKGIFCLPGIVHEFKATDKKHRTSEETNEASSPSFHATKFNYLSGGRSVEIMVMKLSRYLGERYATDGQNHRIYKGRQFLRYIYHLLFPPKIYGIDWRKEEIQMEVIEKFAESQLTL